MTSGTQGTRGSPIPAELSHMSFGQFHAQQRSSSPAYAGDTMPLPSSSPPSPSVVSNHSHVSLAGSTRSMHEANLPPEMLIYCTGVPMLPHYLSAGEEAIDRNVKYRAPTAARYDFVKTDKELVQRRDYLLGIFAESFPGEAQRLGKPIHCNSTVYDFFLPMENQINKAIAGTQVTFKDQEGKELVGYYIKIGRAHV